MSVRIFALLIISVYCQDRAYDNAMLNIQRREIIPLHQLSQMNGRKRMRNLNEDYNYRRTKDIRERPVRQFDLSEIYPRAELEENLPPEPREVRDPSADPPREKGHDFPWLTINADDGIEFPPPTEPSIRYTAQEPDEQYFLKRVPHPDQGHDAMRSGIDPRHARNGPHGPYGPSTDIYALEMYRLWFKPTPPPQIRFD